MKTAKLDYYGFTVPTNIEARNIDIEFVGRRLESALPDPIYRAFFEDVESTSVYRSGYTHGESLTTGVTVFYGGQHHILVEFGGRACQTAFNAELMHDLVQATESRCNRVDVALDFEDVRSIDVVNRGYSKRIKSYDMIETSSGVTHTIGSRSSNRYTKVYEYYPPHERAGGTRIEFTLKGKLAPSAAKFWRYYGAGHVAAAANNTVKLAYLESIPMPQIEEKFSATKKKRLGGFSRKCAPLSNVS